MDADTDGEEGKYYSFKKDELEEISRNTDFDLFTSYFNIELDNPWEDDKYLLLPNEYSLEDDWIKSNNISIKGVNIEECIVLVPVILILAGWCNVLHHSTEYLMIGIFIRPITATMLDIFKGLYETFSSYRSSILF